MPGNRITAFEVLNELFQENHKAGNLIFFLQFPMPAFLHFPNVYILLKQKKIVQLKKLILSYI